jgi:hypothetical protein
MTGRSHASLRVCFFSTVGRPTFFSTIGCPSSIPPPPPSPLSSRPPLHLPYQGPCSLCHSPDTLAAISHRSHLCAPPLGWALPPPSTITALLYPRQPNLTSDIGRSHLIMRKFFCFLRVLHVRNVISGLETNPIRALIGGACLVWQWAPSHTAQQ